MIDQADMIPVRLREGRRWRNGFIRVYATARGRTRVTLQLGTSELVLTDGRGVRLADAIIDSVEQARHSPDEGRPS